MRDIGKGTHAGAANADKMNVFDLIQIDHAVIPPYPHRSWQGFCGNTVRRILLSCFQGSPMHHVQKIGVLQKPFHHVIQSLSRKLPIENDFGCSLSLEARALYS